MVSFFYQRPIKFGKPSEKRLAMIECVGCRSTWMGANNICPYCGELGHPISIDINNGTTRL